MIYDCFSYWDEDLLLDLRLNILNEFVDHFVIVEGNKTWQNNKKDLKFNINNFNRFKNIWHHGDYAEIKNNGGYIIHGRSDTTLNPGGVRLGTAEIYSEVEKFKEIKDFLYFSFNAEHAITTF